jgi:hypothetical protein
MCTHGEVANSVQTELVNRINGGPPTTVPPITGQVVSAQSVPEPATLTLLGTSLAGLIFLRWRRVV